MNKIPERIKYTILLITLSLIAVTYSQWDSFWNEYIVNDDARLHTYWMQKFIDPGLFQNDLLNEYAMEFEPWGRILLFKLLSFLVDPFLASKFLTVILISMTSYAMFLLVRIIVNPFIGFMAGLIVAINPAFTASMVGASGRGFSYVLIILFLYFLIQKKFIGAGIILLLQCLFYPITFFICCPVYVLSFVRLQSSTVLLEIPGTKIRWFLITMICCGSFLIAEYFIHDNPDIGNLVWRSEMLGHSEYTKLGRTQVIPTKSYLVLANKYLQEGTCIPRAFEVIINKDLKAHGGIAGTFTLILILFFVAWEIYRGSVLLPKEIYYLFISGLIMYWIADLLLVQLYFPERYVQYSYPIFGLILFSVFANQIFKKINSNRILKVIKIGAICSILLVIPLTKNIGTTDFSYQKELYEFLERLPVNVLIASHPNNADNISTFAHRKIFIGYEKTVPLYDVYWKTIKKRIFDFFEIYYTTDPEKAYQLCKKNNISYLVVDSHHFHPGYLEQQKFYFEPFNAYVTEWIRGKNEFVLNQISDAEKLYQKNGIFVIHIDSLK